MTTTRHWAQPVTATRPVPLHSLFSSKGSPGGDGGMPFSAEETRKQRQETRLRIPARHKRHQRAGKGERDQSDEDQEGPKRRSTGCSSTTNLSSSPERRLLIASNTGSLLHHLLPHQP